VDQFAYDYYDTSMNFNETHDVIIEHHEYYIAHQYMCGRSFVDICRDMGLDKSNNLISCL
jgi:hypothetical protein